jgi:hypothetical protein
MGNLILNRVGFLLTISNPTIYVCKAETYLFHLQLANLKDKLKNNNHYQEFLEWLGAETADDATFYYGFAAVGDADCFQLTLGDREFKYFKPKYVRELLIRHFQQMECIVEPFPRINDICVYERIGDYNAEWSIFRRYDMLVKGHRNELSFSVGSSFTLISNSEISLAGREHTKGLDPSTHLVFSTNKITAESARIVANRDLRTELGVQEGPIKVNYGNIYSTLKEFYHQKLLTFSNENVRFDASGLKNVSSRELGRVNTSENKMLFGRGQTDINAVSGMREHGPYRASEKASSNKFIFIYQNRDDANLLYQYLKNGLKHFPGIWSYIGIPATLDVDVKLKYSNASSLHAEFDAFLTNSLPNDNYGDYFAIIIGPFTRQDADEEQSELYYHIKERLLRKGIPSQFISEKSIRSGSFHYYLPNISIAILAKLGGIPWRLVGKSYHELVVGFNQKVLGDERFIGSAVFFSNEGELGAVTSYPQSNSESQLIGDLRNSIESYIQGQNAPPNRLVIHYYKPHSEGERQSIEDLLFDELKLSIPFAIVEVNDTKSSMDICFDPDFRMGMPESGTYVTVGKNEYLLFNNTRYQKNPVRSVAEELPVKIKIHFADTGGFSHRELIGQAYEFSRLYWKGLKQKSQPVTTIYSKLVADFAAHFDGDLPTNHLTQNTPWFL